jgi:hypothetical protein
LTCIYLLYIHMSNWVCATVMKKLMRNDRRTEGQMVRGNTKFSSPFWRGHKNPYWLYFLLNFMNELLLAAIKHHVLKILTIKVLWKIALNY